MSKVLETVENVNHWQQCFEWPISTIERFVPQAHSGVGLGKVPEYTVIRKRDSNSTIHLQITRGYLGLK